jgi:RNA polymerase sigma-70 factor (ECF subfamily)
MKETPDHDLMMAVRDGDLDQLAPIFERYHVRLYNYFLRATQNPQTSEDLVQDTFHYILRSRHTYRHDSRFTPWIFTVARSALMTHVRKHRRSKFVVPLPETLEDPRPGPAQTVETGMEINRLRRAMAGLSDEKREALILSRFEHMKYEDIAEIAGCAIGTIKARIHRALNDLSHLYRELGDDLQGMPEESA